MERIIKIIILSILILAVSCTKFLDKPPTKGGEIPERVEQIMGVFNIPGGNNYSFYRTYISDDSEMPFTANEIKSVNMTRYINYIFPAYFQNEIRSNLSSGGGNMWTTVYNYVNADNYVLSVVDGLKGSEEERKIAKAFARFDRGKWLFEAVTSFSLPYKPGVNDNDLGIVLRSDFDLDISPKNLKRSTLKESYDFIEKDLLAGLDLPDGNEIWRLTKKAAYAYIARFYLMIGKYDKVEEYVDKALDKNNTLLNYTLLPTESRPIRRQDILILPYFYDKNYGNGELVKVEGQYFVETFQTSYQMSFPSKSLQQIYEKDTGDVRYLLFPTNGSVNFIQAIPNYRYYSGYSNGGFMLSFPDVAEMILMKAEVLAEKGDLQGAKTQLNTLREKRIRNYNPSSVNNLSSKDDVLDFIYDERRREKPFFLRGLDIRRLKAIKGKNIVIEKDFFEITESTVNPDIPKKYILTDNGYADFLYERDILLSRGYLEQNKK